jgi:hypothetical protein
MSNTPVFPRPDHDYQGMTLRDYFAGQALTALIAEAYSAAGTLDLSDVVPFAYSFADDMITQRHD